MRVTRPSLAVPGALLILLGSTWLAVGCAARGATPTKGEVGTTEPFHDRWWQYYERGVAWAGIGHLGEAETDLRVCLELRQTDRRRARTYGMHFVQCFAHRELGAVLLKLGRLDEAERELRLSLAQEPSAKAEYLLQRLAEQRQGVAARVAHAPLVQGSVPLPAVAEPVIGDAPADQRESVVLEAVAPAAAGFAISGHLQPADAWLWMLPAAGAPQQLVIAADGGFTATVPAGAQLARGDASGPDAAAATLPVVAASAGSLVIEGPDQSRIVHGPRAYYRYKVAATGGVRELVVRDAAGRERGRQQLAGTHAAGTFPVAIEDGAQALTFRLSGPGGLLGEATVAVSGEATPLQDRHLRATALVIPLQSPHPAALRVEDDTRLVGALLADGRFQLQDPGADALLARELALVEAGYVDRATAAAAGRRLATRYVLAGTLTRSPGAQRGDVECYLRLISCDSGAVLRTADAFAEDLPVARDDEFFASVAGLLRQEFPVVEGRVVQRETGLGLDVGARAGVVKSMRFHILPAAGADRQAPLTVVEIQDVEAERARALPVAGGALAPGATAISE
jgi:hypothetical protein